MKKKKYERKEVEFPMTYVYLDSDFFSGKLSELNDKVKDFKEYLKTEFDNLNKAYWLCSPKESPLNPEYYKDFRIKHVCDYDSCSLEVFGVRDETDEEFQKRVKALEAKRASNAKYAAIKNLAKLEEKKDREKKERELLKKLKQKYETEV